jgi:urea transporter
MKKYLKIILRGVGQVMLQNNALTGLLFLIGISYNSWIMAFGAIVGTIISTLTATCLKYSKDDIENGLYGFNGTLVGIAILFLFNFNLITGIFIVLGSILSTFIMHEMKKKIPAYTAPFVISTWIVILIIKILSLAPLILLSPLETSSFYLFTAMNMGLAQVMFQSSVITGLIFILAILVNSRIGAFYAIYGSLLGSLFALLLSLPLTMINVGLFGYNAVLCGIALGTKTKKGFALATFAILLSVILNYFMGSIGIITLTAPFVLATWIVLLINEKK